VLLSLTLKINVLCKQLVFTLALENCWMEDFESFARAVYNSLQRVCPLGCMIA
jgi:hypothetical protein